MFGSLFKPVNDAEKSISNDLDTANFRVAQLENKIKELSFTLDTLWELLVEKNNFDVNAMQDKISAKKNEIESRSNETTNCSSCNRTVPANKASCYYCGAKLS
ncbi:MAG: hypothetical protein P8J61_05955 [Gammaproteobacteria bacterium]|jgi:hypothetical protein|nr:hypothetical protein [Gammaproteobacteria bacterium]